MSSGPSQECLNGRSSGTILLSIISMSSLTSGSQFSLMASEADVWSSWMCISPTENCESSGSCNRETCVTGCSQCYHSPLSGSPRSRGGRPCAGASGGPYAGARRWVPRSGRSRGGSRGPSPYCGWRSRPWSWWVRCRTIQGELLAGQRHIQEREEGGGREVQHSSDHTHLAQARIRHFLLITFDGSRVRRTGVGLGIMFGIPSHGRLHSAALLLQRRWFSLTTNIGIVSTTPLSPHTHIGQIVNQ